MTRKTRLMLYITFVSLFLITAPLIVLYTAGYTFNFSSGKFVQTGLFTISTEPRGALIFINSKLQKQRTNALIKNLAPGEYSVRLEKTGYHAWEKRLPIRSKETTPIENILLFLASEPIIKLEAKLSSIAKDAGSSTFVFSADNGTTEDIIAYANNTFITIGRYAKTDGETKLIVSKNGTWVAIKLAENNQDKWIAVKQEEKNKTIDISGIVDGKIFEFYSDPVEPGIFYAITKENLWKIDAENNSAEILLNEPVAGYSSQTGITIARNQNGRSEIIRVEQQNETPLAILPAWANEFASARGQYLVVRDKEQSHIAVIDTLSQSEPILLQTSASISEWASDPSDTRLLYSDGFEIHIYDPRTHTDELVTRSSELFQDIVWHPSGTFVITAQGGNIQAIELDSRGKRNVINLAKFDSANALLLQNSAKLLEIIGTTNEKTGVYELEIVEK
ncbi:MAG: hypothetical protein ACD_76C00078G0008 [uncultured bacterium]|nr:MAG: hypothetical protein ACD_76C00078G0008 [uncultured bacterium]HBD05003.1 hypothetical protein [Candidatus Uhrbacteria bacterium]